ncbi:MAG: prepilin-type N-terminal cleavage/methylation domain-containing protein [Armatimonadota bacterium]|nr:prepilin-type N-terminal cleavage/methylation domain-containing protein [Armatimonadota bacterium]MDR7427429.1 prepilin-type N-terminal cleavage/methylation domain-containing protein [Armatimonadota bacterium]MDR7463909.1 prepilin-type N-terminal cleavage/methylation domain-containing protein [Armatimonadota bacterium]MDR7470747.1 prepilin-type N-terminal cleavage/methylation domain-containing protein [Armatimonadota bacterium]MDR7475008.1 prepilin-type N-terminal cleavage/methylation domain
MRRDRAAGFTFLELIVVLSLVAVLLGLAFSSWRGHVAKQRLRYGIVQVATGLRQAQERAKEARVPYTVTFVEDSSAYTIAGGGFVENATMPDGVTAADDDLVTFSAFGQPDAAHTITLRNSTGEGTVTVNATGGITYQTP